MTLPIIYTLNNAPSTEVKRLKYIIKNENDQEDSIREAIALVIKHKGINYADSVMRKLGEEAKALLNPFPDNEAKRALIGLVDYTMNRTK